MGYWGAEQAERAARTEPVNLVTRVELVNLVTRAVQVNHTEPVEQETRGSS